MEVSNPLFQAGNNNKTGNAVGGALSPGSTSPLSSHNSSQDDPQHSPHSATSTSE